MPSHPSVSRQKIDDYLTAFEAALERVPAPLRHHEVDGLREELSWLDSRGSAALLAALGTPEAAARAIRERQIAADEVRGRRAVAAICASGAVALAIAVIAVRRFLRINCSCGRSAGVTTLHSSEQAPCPIPATLRR